VGDSPLMKVDLHVHTSERSGCARSTEEDQIRAAIKSGLDAIVITDHERLVPQDRLNALNAKYTPFWILSGIEIRFGVEDVLVLGVQDSAMEHRPWSYPELHAFVEERGGLLAIVHPFRYQDHIALDLDRCPPHALELHSHNIPPQADPRIREVAGRLDVPMVSNSDAHHTSAIGDHYNVLEEEPENEAELMAMLKVGAFEHVEPTD
jgi:histidinol phosphatase-like PHP family hydrolase